MHEREGGDDHQDVEEEGTAEAPAPAHHEAGLQDLELLGGEEPDRRRAGGGAGPRRERRRRARAQPRQVVTASDRRGTHAKRRQRADVLERLLGSAGRELAEHLGRHDGALRRVGEHAAQDGRELVGAPHGVEVQHLAALERAPSFAEACALRRVDQEPRDQRHREGEPHRNQSVALQGRPPRAPAAALRRRAAGGPAARLQHRAHRLTSSCRRAAPGCRAPPS